MKVSKLILVPVFLIVSFQSPEIKVESETYYLERTLTKFVPENKPFYPINREITRLLTEGVEKDKISPKRYIITNPDQVREIKKEFFFKGLIKRSGIMEELDEAEEDTVKETEEEPERYSPRDLHIRVLEKVTVEDGSISESNPLWLDLFVSGVNTPDKIDRYLGSFRFEEVNALFKDDPRATWYNPKNNAEKTSYDKAIALRLYRPNFLSVLDEEGNHIFYTTLDFGGDNPEESPSFIKEEYKIMQEGNLDLTEIGSDENYKSYFIERTLALNDTSNQELIDDSNILMMLYEAGVNKVIPVYFPEEDNSFKSLPVEEFKEKFTTEENKDNLPLDKIGNLVLIEEVKVTDDNKKDYKIKYIGLMVPSDKSYSGYEVHLGYFKLEDTENILKTANVNPDQTYFEYIKNRNFEGSTRLIISNVFGDVVILKKDDSGELNTVGEIKDDALKTFKKEFRRP